jgi:hypothetical protein
MENKHKDNALYLFQMDLIQNGYHFFNSNKAKLKEYYPEELLKLIQQISSSSRKFKIEVGEIYSVRAFFALSKQIDNKIAFESGFLDLKLIMKEQNSYIGQVVTTLPPIFVLKKGSKVKFKKENIIYKPDYR